MAKQRDPSKGHPVFEFLNRRIGAVATLVVIAAITLAVVAPSIANEEQVSFDPKGDIYDIGNRAEDVFFITDHDNQPITEAKTMRELSDRIEFELEDQP